MRIIHRNHYGVFLYVFCFLSLICCASKPPGNPPVTASLLKLHEGGLPLTAVILPFENLTPQEDLHTIVRETFCGRFGAKNYHDYELNEVDRILEMYGRTHSQRWQDLSHQALGELFQADVLVYGKALEYKKYFLGIYSQISLAVGIEMVECRTGEVIWEKALLKRSHDGGIPFSLFGIVPASLRSGYHLREETTLALADQISRELVESMPDPPAPALAPYVVDIQVASFLEKSLAMKAMDSFEKKGHRPRIETVTLAGRLWYRLLLGPYKDASGAEKVVSTLETETEFKPLIVHRYHSPEIDHTE